MPDSAHTALLAVVEAEWPRLTDPEHPEHEPAPNAGRRLRLAAARARESCEPPPIADFAAWLAGQAERRDQVGQLARDARRDAAFPAAADLPVYREYLLDQGAPDVALDALAAAWHEFEAQAEAAA